ncbi:hypothetical protein ERO13_D09G189600v2 [Gossypium hirsutum]|nr:hypothetical protein ERO13_D09G189600v2 [Gossypium hirsutum]
MVLPSIKKRRRKFSIYVLAFLVIVLQLFSYFNPCSASNGYNHHESKQFIKKPCRATSYPDLCFKSLARHASKIQAQATSRIHKLRPNEVAAMVDCIAGLTDLVQKLQMSTKVMDEGGKDNGVVRVDDSNDVIQVEMNDIQMWVNMGLEEEETCKNGLANMDVKGKVNKGIRKGIVNVAHLTSNALAFVKSFAFAHN